MKEYLKNQQSFGELEPKEEVANERPIVKTINPSGISYIRYDLNSAA